MGDRLIFTWPASRPPAGYTGVMKRDMGLIRKILEHVEKHGDGIEDNLDLKEVEIDIAIDNIGANNETYPFLKIHYHTWLCVNGGLVEGQVSLDPRVWATSRLSALTWKGHDMLEELRRGPTFLSNRD